MRHRPRLYYTVSYYGRKRHISWSSKIGWCDSSEVIPPGGWSSDANVKTFRKALRLARGLRNKLGADHEPGKIRVTRWFYRRGNRYCQEFVL